MLPAINSLVATVKRHAAKATSRWLLTLLLAATAVPCAGQTSGSTSVSYSVEDLLPRKTTTINGSLTRPSASSPAPAVIVLHGCGGPIDKNYNWARTVAGWGYVALVPDSLGSRGLGQVCDSAGGFSPDLRVVDIVGAAKYLASQPFVRGDRLALLGLSHGGTAVLDALQKDLSTIGIKGGVAYYPNCRPSAHTGLALPALVLIGDKDDWTSAENCRVLQSLMPKRPALLDIVYYPTAYHGFDDVTMLPGRTYFGHRVEYDRSASHDAIERTRAFLDRLLR